MSPLHTEAKLHSTLDEWIVKIGKRKRLRCTVPLAAWRGEDEAVTGVILDLILLLEWELSLGFEWSVSVIIQLKQYDLKAGRRTESLVGAFSACSVARPPVVVIMIAVPSMVGRLHKKYGFDRHVMHRGLR
ncbi:hypothetical protein CBL_10521 [Carabus blaptoides fortunei]